MIRCRVISPSVKNHKIGDILFLDKETMVTLVDFVEAAPLEESNTVIATNESNTVIATNESEIKHNIVPQYEHRQKKKR